MSTPSFEAHVLRALHAARTPGWMFPAHFLDLYFERPVSEQEAVACMHIGPHCTEASGRVSKAAMAVLADVSMAAAVRGHVGHSVRIATMSLRLSFHHQPSEELLRAVAQVRFLPQGLTMGIAVVTLHMQTLTGGVCCVGEGTFAVLENKNGTANHPLPVVSTLIDALTEDALTQSEHAVLQLARQSQTFASASCSPMEYFWGLAQRHSDGSPGQRLISIGKHNSNRVGHLQGGIVLGVLADACMGACESADTLVDIAVQYLEPVAGSQTYVQVMPLRNGRSAEQIQGAIVGHDGKLQAMAQCSFVNKVS